MGVIQHIQLTNPKNLLTDVENRRVYNLDHCELNVFETYRESEKVQLSFHDTVITSMVRGKKVMHLQGTPGFEYFPGETVLAPAGTSMLIDFPEAQVQNPTQCIALTLDAQSVNKAIDYLNEYFPRFDEQVGWNINFNMLHLKNNTELADVINKMVNICTSKALTKDVLADLTMKELIVRIVQLQSLEDLNSKPLLCLQASPFADLLHYINNNIGDRLNIDLLCRKMYMSRSHFFRAFKREFGISPVQYIIKERIKRAKAMLTHTNQTIQQVSMEAGFDDVNNFIKIFKRMEGLTPGMYRQRAIA